MSSTIKRDSLLKSTSHFTLATLITRVLGLVRDSCIAGLVPSQWQDIFWSGFKIPSTFRQLFAEGALSAAFIPLLTRVREREGEEKAREISAAIFHALNLFVAAVVIAAIFLSPWFVPYILDFPVEPVSSPSLEGGNMEGVSDWRIHGAIRATQYMFPFLFFVSLSAWAMGILNSYRHFFIPAVAPALFNVSLIAGCMVAAWFFDGMPMLLVLSASVVLGGLLQFVVQIPSARKIGFYPPRRISPFHPAVKTFLRMVAPSVFGLAIYQINALITQTYFASKFGEGGISQMNYAFRLIQFPLGVVGVALASASFPRVAQYIAQERRGDAAKILSDVIKYLMLLIIPAAVGFIVLGPDIVGLIYNHGNFQARNWLLPTYHLLVAYSIGLFFYTVVKVLVQAFQAHHDFRTPVMTGSIAVTVNIALCALFVECGWPLWSLAVASSLASLLHTLLLTILLGSRMKELTFLPLFDFLMRVLMACGGMAVVCWAVAKYFPFSGDTKIEEAFRVFAGIGLGMAAYFGLGWVLYKKELRAILRLK